MTYTNNKTMRNAYERYESSRDYDLFSCYERPSHAKMQAWEYCKSLCEKHDGYGLKIIGFNTMSFSAGFVGEIDGEIAFFYITKDYDRWANICDVEG